MKSGPVARSAPTDLWFLLCIRWGLSLAWGSFELLNLSLVKMRCLSLGRERCLFKTQFKRSSGHEWCLLKMGHKVSLLKYVSERSATQYFKEAHKWAHLLQRQKFTLLNILTCLLYILFKEISCEPMYLLL